MKFNKLNPIHILIYLFGTLIFNITFLLNNKEKQNKEKAIILYGHKLYGNLKAIYEKLDNTEFEFYFLTLDYKVYKKLNKKNLNVLYGLNFFHMIKIVNSKIFISDHGLHFMKKLLKMKNIHFFDANHGLPYQKWNEESLKQFYDYEEVWLSSNFHKEVYKNEFGYKEENIVVTGFGRLDYLKKFNKLNSKSKYISELKEKYNINFDDKLALYAPTWVHNKVQVQNEFMLPTNIFFLVHLNNIGKILNIKFIFRPHLNTKLSKKFIRKVNKLENILFFPFDKFEEVEEFLIMSDFLITDWSSIALDFILLDRPTIFLDVKNSFTLGIFRESILRYGKICNLEELENSLSKYKDEPKLYFSDCKNHEETKKLLYDNFDEEVSENYIVRIKKFI